MKALFITKPRNDPTTRYRIAPLEARLQDLGFETELVSETDGLWQKRRLLAQIAQTDLVIIQRKLFSGLMLRMIRQRCEKIVFDFDDAIFCKSSGEPSVRRMKRFNTTLATSTLVLAGNGYLAEHCVDANCEVIPTPVDPQRYPAGIAKDQGCSLVWVGSQSTRKYLDASRPVLESLGTRMPRLVLKVIADFDYELSSMKVENIPWSEAAEVQHICSAQIGIAPMTDNPWTKGKCALKVIQYMAAGLPVVSSAVGANRDVVVHGETGFLAQSAEEWIHAIATLSDSAARRQEMGARGLARMKKYYATDVVLEQIESAFRSNNLIAPL